MDVKKILISVILICTLAFSFMGGAVATYLSELPPDEGCGDCDDLHCMHETSGENAVEDDSPSPSEEPESPGDDSDYELVDETLPALADAHMDIAAIEQFVNRLYGHVLGRSPDATGLHYWMAHLKNGTTGASVAHGFFFSREFLSRNVSNERFVDILYLTLLNRQADASGRAYWMNKINAGIPREEILAGFVVSNEFTRLCNDFGIVRGAITTLPGGQDRVLFITRLYRNVLGREPDQIGLHHWKNALESGMTGAEIAYQFFFSREFIARNVSNSGFIDILYLSLLNRAADAPGKAYWLSQLDLGLPRENILAGFISSTEFTNICKQFGIERGTYTPPFGGAERIFVIRLYREALRREPTQTELAYWVERLTTGTTGAEVAYGFIFSNELMNRSVTNEQFVDILYNSLLGRAPGASERAHWVERLRNSVSRYSVFAGVVESNEFDRVCRIFGIQRGAAPLPENTMGGNTRIAKVWNLIVKQHFNGISDRPEHIAGIIGNLQSEAGPALCPFQVQISNQQGLGLMQWTNPGGGSTGRRTSLENFMWASGINREQFTIEMNKHLNHVCSSPCPHPPEFLNRVLEVQIDFMFHELKNTWEGQYMGYINYPSNRVGVAGARAYAELFCALALRPGTGREGIDNIQDAGVRNARQAWGTRNGVSATERDRISFSNLDGRRNRAEQVFLEFQRNHR